MGRIDFFGRVALTGVAASGKSTVLGFFRELGWTTASADDVAAELFRDEEFHRRLARELGGSFPLDRSWLREKTFMDDDFRRKMNRAFHQPVMERLAGLDAEILEVPLLFESVLGGWFGVRVAVSCDLADQRSRLVSRLGDGVLVDKFVRMQLPQSAKVALSDAEIRTSCSFADVLSQTEKLSLSLRNGEFPGRS